MKRNMDLIRDLLLKLESLDKSPTATVVIHSYDEELRFEGITPDEVEYHLLLIREAGLIEPPHRSDLFQRLSWAGHDFVDSVRDPDIWARTKQGAEAVKGFTVDLLVDFAKGLVKKGFEHLLGV